MAEQEEGKVVSEDGEIKDFLSNAEVTVTPYTKWEDIIGIETAKEKMKEWVILPFMFPHLFTGRRSRNLILFGPPGSGKTLLVHVAIAELKKYDVLCYRLSVYDLMTRYLKNPIEAIRAIFKKAESCKNTVMFIEDFDVLSEKTDMSRNLARELFALTREFRSKGHECALCIVGITNKPWKLLEDYSLKRIMEYRVYTPLPNRGERTAMFKKQLSSLQHNLLEEDFRMLGDRSEGLSGADISVVVRDSSMQPIRRIQVATHFKHICGPSPEDPNKMVDDLLTPCSSDDPDAIKMDWTQIDANKLAPQIHIMEDVLKSLATQKPTVSKDELDMNEHFKEEWGAF